MFEHPTNYLAISGMINGKDNIIHSEEIWKEIYSPPIIGNDVWIGSNSVILQGVKIGDGAIIAAGAVVTKDVPSYTIWGGVPAKFIKDRFDEECKNYLQNLKWWDLSEAELRKLSFLFEAKEEWFKKI